MTTSPFVQKNPYKGTNPRCWLRLRFAAVDGSLHERELVADTGSPFGVILGQADMALLRLRPTAGVTSNFGYLAGGWLDLRMPELGLTNQILGYGSDQVMQAIQHDSADFAGLVPLLHMVEYCGDATSFWVRKPAGVP